MDRIFIKILNMGFAAGLLVPVVLVLRLALRKAPKWTRCVLWAVVALRLILPVEIASPLSLFNALGSQSNGSVEYFHAAGGSEKPLVSFDTLRFDGAAAPEDTLIDLPDGAPSLARHTATRYLPPLVAAWLIGVGVMLLYMLWSYARLRRRVGASVPLEDRVLICDGIDAPFILGLFRPRVFLPSTLTEPQLSHVLAHERAHLARRDHWWKPLGFVLLAVYWFHPLLWLAYFLLCRDIELACDEKVLKSMDPSARTDYSQALLDLSRPRPVAACPLAFGETGVRARVKAALRYKKPAFWLILAAAVLCAFAAVSFLTNPVRYPSEVAPGEQQLLYAQLADSGCREGKRLATDVLYDQNGRARYLFGYGVSADAYVILDRKGDRLLESGFGNPYTGYMGVPKFYSPHTYLIRGYDVYQASPEHGGEYFNLASKTYSGRISNAARRVTKSTTSYYKVPAMLTVLCGEQSVEAFEALRWSEGGGVSADGAPLEDQIRENADRIPTLVRTGEVVAVPREDVRVVEGVLQVFDASMRTVIDRADGVGLAGLQTLTPGEYWCAVEVRMEQGDGASCCDCVFRLKVPGSVEVIEGVPEDVLKALQAPPLGADPEIMATYPIVVTDLEMNIYNMDYWDDFYAKSQAGEPADVTIALYTAERESTLYFIRYDGDRFLLVRDNTRNPQVQSPSYEIDHFAYLRVLSRDGCEIAVLSDEPYAGYEEYYEALYTETEHPALCVMMWKEIATQKPGDAIPVTKQLLLKFVDDQIAMYEAQKYQHENEPPEEADPAMLEEIDLKLNELRFFRDEAAENATEENVISYWDRFWLEILEQPLPEGYGRFPKEG